MLRKALGQAGTVQMKLQEQANQKIDQTGSRQRLQRRRTRFGARRRRAGSASMDYVLVFGVILSLATFMFLVVPRMIQLVYEFTITLVGSPLM